MFAAASFSFLAIILEGEVQRTLAIIYSDSDFKGFGDEIG